MTAVLPHRTLEGLVELRIEAVALDGAPRTDRVEGHLQRIDLTGLGAPGWQKLSFEARADAPENDVARFLDEDVALKTVLVISNSTTNLRVATPMERDEGEGDSSWTTVIELDADDLRGKVDIYAEVSADLDGRPARRVGQSSTWDLYVDEAARPPFAGTFQVHWSHFSGAERNPAVPEHAATESFFVDLASTTPAIHLNKDIDGLPELLEGDDQRPDLERALRDAEMRRIATAAWTAAIGAAAASIRIDPDSGEHEFPDVEWRADILRWGLPLIYPTVSSGEGLKRIRQDVLGDQADVTQALIQLAVSRHMRAGELLQTALKAVSG
jgi:hypothetical protein